jgi:hypothetical protein
MTYYKMFNNFIIGVVLSYYMYYFKHRRYMTIALIKLSGYANKV